MDDWIGDRLRQVYSQVLEEPIPEAWAELLRNAEQRSKGGGGQS